MIRFLRVMTIAYFIEAAIEIWQEVTKRRAERRRALEIENANPVRKLVKRVKTAQEQMHERMHERMREHINA